MKGFTQLLSDSRSDRWMMVPGGRRGLRREKSNRLAPRERESDRESGSRPGISFSIGRLHRNLNTENPFLGPRTPQAGLACFSPDTAETGTADYDREKEYHSTGGVFHHATYCSR